MPKGAHVGDPSQETAGHNYDIDPRWRKKPITPAQILVHDVRLETWRADRGPLLECSERSAHTLVPEMAATTPSASLLRVGEATDNPIEKQKFTDLEQDYGWTRTRPDVSFRGIRNNYFTSDDKRDYTAVTHAIASLSGAVGMLHRNFWPDLYLCLADRYAGHLGHLQYRLHRAPSTKLVMDLIACQEELNIVIQITEQQLETISVLQGTLEAAGGSGDRRRTSSFSRSTRDRDDCDDQEVTKRLVSQRSTYRQLSTSLLSDPIAQLLDNLERELADLRDLRDNTDRLVTRTIQLVNIRLEDHGKAILVFTVVTIVFLPLNFVSSFFGMNFRDIRDMQTTQWLFWAVAIAVTVGVVASSVFLAFSGGLVLEKFHIWRDTRRDTRLFTTSSLRQSAETYGKPGFRVHGTDQAYGGASTQAG